MKISLRYGEDPERIAAVIRARKDDYFQPPGKARRVALSIPDPPNSDSVVVVLPGDHNPRYEPIITIESLPEEIRQEMGWVKPACP